MPNLEGTCPGRVVRRPEQLLSDREVKEICEQIFNRVWEFKAMHGLLPAFGYLPTELFSEPG